MLSVARESPLQDMMINPKNTLEHIHTLCAGGDRALALIESWSEKGWAEFLAFTVPVILLGCGAYGFSMGIWQGWEMAAYVAIKLPNVIFLTLILNGLLNGMLGLILGSGLKFLQSVQFLLVGFTLMSVMLLVLSPVMIFVATQAPEPSSASGHSWHSISILAHVTVVAYAGISSHLILLDSLRRFTATKIQGTQTFFAWLIGNLFVGAQVSWVLRPFFGTPGVEIQFLRGDPFSGSFYEAIWISINQLITN